MNDHWDGLAPLHICIKHVSYPELALYALDLYYQQQFGPDVRFIPEAIKRVDYPDVANNYQNYYYATSSLPNTYANQLPYYDPFHRRYRSFGTGWMDLEKIMEWIVVARET